MIIKKWNSTGSVWEAQAIETTAQSIKTSMGGGSVFDSNNKLYPAYLPDMALAGMRFISTLTAAETDTMEKVAALIHTQVAANYLQTPTASPFVMHGLYWIASAAAGTSFPIVNAITTLSSGKYYCVIAAMPGEEASNSSIPEVEAGDWVIIQDFSGSGTQLDPYLVKLGIINNTYGIMSSASYGIAKLGYTTNGKNYKVDIDSGNLYVNVPWTDTVYTHPNHTGDVTSSGDGATTIAANAVTTAKINDGAVTNSKLADVAVNTIKGRATAGTGDVEDLTAAQVRSILNVADGATANTGTVTSVGLSSGTGITISGGPITTSGSITVTNSAPNATHTGDVTGSAALTIAANAVTTAKINDGAVTNSKLADVAVNTIKGRATAGTGDVEDLTAAQVRSILNVADGATANTGTVTSVGLSSGTGITISGGPITTSGSITVTNSAPNATHTGDVTGSAALTIASNVVSNAKLADMAQYTVKGKNTSGTGDPVDMTAAQLRTMIDTIQTFSGTTTPSSTVGMLTGAIWFDG